MVELVGKHYLLDSIVTKKIKSSVLVHMLNDLFNDPNLSWLYIKRQVNELKHPHHEDKLSCVFHAYCHNVVNHPIHIVNWCVYDVSRVHVFIQLIKILLHDILVPRSLDRRHVLQRIFMIFVSRYFVKRRLVEVSTSFNPLIQHSFILLFGSINQVMVKISLWRPKLIDFRCRIRRVLPFWYRLCPNRHF